MRTRPASRRGLRFSCRRQGEKIDAAIEGNDPAIEQFVGAQALAAEIVDDEHAVVGLHLRRGDIEL
jgi:hypothetical protein